MAVRTCQFISSGSTVTSGAVIALYTTGSGRTALVRHFQMVNRSGVTADAAMGVRKSGVTAWLAASGALAFNGQLGGGGLYLVLNPGDELVVYLAPVGGAAAAVSVLAGGSLLLGTTA